MFEKMKELLKMNDKGFAMNQMVGLGLGLTVLIIVVFLGVTIGEEFQGQATVNGTAYNLTGEGITNYGEIVDWIPILVIAVVAAIVLSLVISAFGGRFNQ